jgi:hypothetical protein
VGLSLAAAAAFGLAVATLLLTWLQGLPAGWLMEVGAGALLGAAALASAEALAGARPPALAACLLGPVLAIWPVGGILLVPVDVLLPVSFVSGSALLYVVSGHRRGFSLVSVGVLAALGLVGSVAGAGAWSVNEPSASDPRMVAGNGIVVSFDTHAFLIQQGAVILGNDGRSRISAFLSSADPQAPMARTSAGRPTTRHESYLWRLELGARDADRSLKAKHMPDHFFNWWTHSGKGLVAGTSAATWAEQQFAQAVKEWHAGDQSLAMYHLGAATHLVDDACAPPHESLFVPNHRAYENWILARQARQKVTSGGVYQKDFRVRTGHGGPAWSSSHTRGWVDECSHRAAELVVNTAQPPSDDPGSGGPLDDTFSHFRDTQRLTAGYLAFFFDTVGGLR